MATSKSKKRNKLKVKTSRFGETEITKFASTSCIVLGVCQKFSLFLTDCRSTQEGYKMYGFISNSPFFKIFIVLFLPNLRRMYPGFEKKQTPLKHLVVSSTKTSYCFCCKYGARTFAENFYRWCDFPDIFFRID